MRKTDMVMVMWQRYNIENLIKMLKKLYADFKYLEILSNINMYTEFLLIITQRNTTFYS